MLIQKIKCWLWNQMFQYAYIRALSLRTKSNFVLDISDYETYFRNYDLEIFNIQKNYATKKDIPRYQRFSKKNKLLRPIKRIIQMICSKINPNHYEEKNMFKNPKNKNSIIDENFLHIKSWYIEWFFQSEKYFDDYTDIIKKDFEFNKSISNENKEIEKLIKETESVSIHIRRWDYLKLNNLYNILDENYYNKWISLLKKEKWNLKFFIFSDDIERCKEHLNIDNAFYVKWNNWNKAWQDMYLMSCCKHNIIANSSFSWWWAWLNNNPHKKVIAPKKWFSKEDTYQNDIIPTYWTKI